MEIKAAIFEGTYDFKIELDEYKPNSESNFTITIDDTTIVVNRKEWESLNELVTNSMNFLDNNN